MCWRCFKNTLALAANCLDNMKLKYYCFSLCLFAFQTSFAQTWNDTLSLIDNAFSVYKPANPGCQFAILKTAKSYLRKHGELPIWNIMLLFLIAQFLRRGLYQSNLLLPLFCCYNNKKELSLDDDVRKYVPELPHIMPPSRFAIYFTIQAA